MRLQPLTRLHSSLSQGRVLFMHRIWIALCVFNAISLAQTGTGAIQGTVIDRATNKPIGGAIVTAIRKGLPPASGTVKSAADGAFQIQNLSSGAYSLCVQVPGSSYLNPCQWEMNPP